MAPSDAPPRPIRALHPGRSAAARYTPWPDVPAIRRRTMSAIRSRDTTVEMVVRRLLHREGYRYVVGRRVAGYRPDLLFTLRRKAIFVHGCFWHGHEVCRQDRTPKTRTDYWRKKLAGNKERDAHAEAALQAAGWQVLTLWECDVRRDPGLRQRLTVFLGPRRWA
jgi:DNA mismatch endonuclease, patch repair protein